MHIDAKLAAKMRKAVQLAKKHGETYFVVRDDDELHICTDEDLDTFFMGISQDNILFSTDEANDYVF